MTQDKKVFELGTVPLIGQFELIAIPTLIEVQVIKKKIVEQMSELPLKMLEEADNDLYRIVGRVGPYVVYHTDSHQFVKIHRNEFADYAMSVIISNIPKDERVNHNEVSKNALKIFYGLPQMFEG